MCAQGNRQSQLLSSLDLAAGDEWTGAQLDADDTDDDDSGDGTGGGGGLDGSDDDDLVRTGSSSSGQHSPGGGDGGGHRLPPGWSAHYDGGASLPFPSLFPSLRLPWYLARAMELSAGRWPLASGCCLPAAGCWLLAAGCWLLSTRVPLLYSCLTWLTDSVCVCVYGTCACRHVLLLLLPCTYRGVDLGAPHPPTITHTSTCSARNCSSGGGGGGVDGPDRWQGTGLSPAAGSTGGRDSCCTGGSEGRGP